MNTSNNAPNLFIMNYDEITKWYKPKTPEEEYIIEVMKDFIKYDDTDDIISQHKSSIQELLIKNSDLEKDVTALQDDVYILRQDIIGLEIQNCDLEDKISDLESR